MRTSLFLWIYGVALALALALASPIHLLQIKQHPQTKKKQVLLVSAEFHIYIFAMEQ